ncbi:MAG TPA: response regulator [Polyangiaceae bacterium]|nr:response regulator [Polyangiaceae bacterium]
MTVLDLSPSKTLDPVVDALPSDILVVDDTPENLTAIEVALDELNYRLVKAQSGKEALRRLLKQDFALILLDVQMPGMTGFETARLIRARDRSRQVPIIFITAYDRDDEEVLEAYRLGAVDFLFKPIQPEILKAKASVFVELSRRTQEVERQAEQIRAHVLQERESWLAEQRNRIEAEVLKRRLEEQRLHAAELERLNRRLEEGDRRKDEFIAVLGHELRNPLAPLVNGLELLETADGEAVERARLVMRRQVDHLIRLVDDLLDISRVSRGKIELRPHRLRAGELLDHAVALATPLIGERGHTLTTVREAEHLVINGDEVRLTQVLANLLNNAARYTEPGGKIWLGVHQQGGGVEFRVKDTGKGIPPELLPRVFDLFVQERQGGGGLGIGLTLVKQLVGMHEGRVEAFSDGPGRGSEFRVWLPASPYQLEAEAASEPNEAPPSTLPEAGQPRGLHVALIEDNDDARVLMGEVLESWGHEVRQASTGAIGVDLILQQRPDIAFIDIGLPDMDGYELARQVRSALGRDGPLLIALSGFSQRRDRERASKAGFDDHLAKPANPADLRRLLTLAGRALAQPADTARGS